MLDSVTHLDSPPGVPTRHGRSVGTVALLFGLSGRPELPGVSLRALLGDLGHSDDAARALLSRMRRRGQLATTRRGREVGYRLAGDTARGFEFIRRRSLGEIAESEWDGVFHTVLHHVPEVDRGFRDTLRRAARLAGYGTLQPGVLVAPHDYRAQLEEVLTDRPEGAQLVFGRLTVDGADAPRLIEVTWDLARVAATYAEHLNALEGMLRHSADLSGAVALRTFAGTVAPALSATLGEPDVPPSLLPADWAGARLRRLAAECGERIGPAAGRHVAAVLATAGEHAAANIGS